MPRETIRNRNGCADADFCLSVGWSREGEWVDVVTYRPDGVIGLREEHGKQGQDGDFREIQAIERPGWVVNLSRHDINNLIRVLRRARDQAFGKDE